MSRPPQRGGFARLLLGLLALLGACGGRGGQETALPYARVVAVRDLGVVPVPGAVRGRDGGYSAWVHGRSAWLYGDTVLDREGSDGSRWRNNTASWSADLDASDGLGAFEEWLDAAGTPVEFLPRTDAEHAFNLRHAGEACEEPCGARWALWPADLVWDAARSRALVFHLKVYAEPGEWNFHSVGTSVALWDDPEAPPSRPVLDVVPDHPTLLFAADEPAFGSAAVVEGETLYVYGCSGPEKSCVLARVALLEVLDRSAWSFWAGDGWTTDLDAAVPVMRAADMLTVHWNEHLRRWLAIYAEPFTNQVRLRTAPDLVGPWSGASILFEARAPTVEGARAYGALGHAELQSAGGRLEYVTYFRATGFLAGEVRLVEVELE